MGSSIMSIADVDSMIEHLRNARKEIIGEDYFVKIRPDVRDRIIELLFELKKKTDKEVRE